MIRIQTALLKQHAPNRSGDACVAPWSTSAPEATQASRLRVGLILVLFCFIGQSALAQTTQPDARAAFLKIIDRPKVDPAPEEKSGDVKDGIQTNHFWFNSEANQRIPGIVLAHESIFKDGQHHPVVIVLHGTGGKKEAEMATLRDLANRDFLAVAIDARYHGERGNQTQYNAAIAQAFADGKSHPLYYDEVWDMLRLIDYLQSRGEVDPKRIGLMGISKGGIETWLTAAVDPRVAVAIPCISAQCFQWGLDNDRWHGRISTVQKAFDEIARANGVDKPDSAFVERFYDRLLPGIHTQFDGPKMLPLIAPRPLLIISGDKDPMNPVEGLHICQQATQPVYQKLNAGDRFKVILQENTGHAVNKEAHDAAMAWFEKWLR